MLTLGTRTTGMRPIIPGSCTSRGAALARRAMMLAMPHVPFLPTIVGPLAAIGFFLIGSGHRRRRSPAHLMSVFFCPAAPMGIVLSLRRYVEHPEAMRVLASQAGFVQE